MPFENRIEAWAESPTTLTFGSTPDHFWINVGPAHAESMKLTLKGNWPRDLYEALGRYLNGSPDELDRDVD
jgi:hypothetical protein